MPTYVWKGKDRYQLPIVREINANTVEESKAILQADGCTDLALMSDDIMAAATAGMADDVKFFGKKLQVSETDKVKFHGQKSPTFLSAIWEGVRLTGVRWLLIVAAIAALQIYRGSVLGLGLVGLGLLAWFAFLVTMYLPGIYYGRLHKAADWHRWDEVWDLVEKLKQVGKFHIIKVPAPELGRFRAKVLAARGRLDEALAEYAQYEDKPGCPRWLYLAFVAGLYNLAKQYDNAIEWNWKSIHEKSNPAMYLDLANRYARHKGDAFKALAALAEAEKGIIPDALKAGHLRIRGIVAYVEGNHAEAKKDLEASLTVLAGNPNQPFRDGSLGIARAYLCLVLDRLGDREGAKQNFLAARDYLVATDEPELLEQCQRATAT
jgi:tetratricopeptide (TPR) repeat protein